MTADPFDSFDGTVGRSDLEQELYTTILQIITAAGQNSPRSHQMEVGPSDVGNPCERALGYRYAELPVINLQPANDPWASIVGTSIHTWLAETFTAADPVRWLTEQRVYPDNDLMARGGSSDVYDTVTENVIDWKTNGVAALREFKKTGPVLLHRYQAHIYGLGWEAAGRTPANVAIVALPRSGRLRESFVHVEPYDPAVAQEALERARAIRGRVLAPEGQALALTRLETADNYCGSCRYLDPGSLNASAGCPGSQVMDRLARDLAAASSYDELLAMYDTTGGLWSASLIRLAAERRAELERNPA